MPEVAARILSLRRYIGLLRQEKMRLDSARKSPLRTDSERSDAEANLGLVTKRLHDAERELTNLEMGRQQTG